MLVEVDDQPADILVVARRRHDRHGRRPRRRSQRSGSCSGSPVVGIDGTARRRAPAGRPRWPAARRRRRRSPRRRRAASASARGPRSRSAGG